MLMSQVKYYFCYTNYSTFMDVELDDLKEDVEEEHDKRGI